MIAMQEDTLLSLKEAARQLDVSLNTIRKFIENGELQGIKVGGRIKVRKSVIEQFLNKNIINRDK